MSDPFRLYRPWFHAAAAYNALWGAAVALWPEAFMRLAGLAPSSAAIPFVQVMGMMVGVYPYGYHLLARAPPTGSPAAPVSSPRCRSR